MKFLILSLVAFTGSTLGLFANDADAKKPIFEVAVKAPAAKGGMLNPIKITSAEEATKALGEEEAKKLGDKVNFKTHTLLVFAWAGSGGDKLTYSVAESSPEQITFNMKRGLTRDLRQHSAAYAVRNDCKWSVK